MGTLFRCSSCNLEFEAAQRLGAIDTQAMKPVLCPKCSQELDPTDKVNEVRPQSDQFGDQRQKALPQNAG